jgi:hypothetical protein
MTHNPATHVVIDRCDLSTAAFWLGQLARWLDDPNHASQFSWDLFGIGAAVQRAARRSVSVAMRRLSGARGRLGRGRGRR